MPYRVIERDWLSKSIIRTTTPISFSKAQRIKELWIKQKINSWSNNKISIIKEV